MTQLAISEIDSIVSVVDIDECVETLDRGGCHELAVCKNRDGGYDCECRPGTTGDGFFCRGTHSLV